VRTFAVASGSSARKRPGPRSEMVVCGGVLWAEAAFGVGGVGGAVGVRCAWGGRWGGGGSSALTGGSGPCGESWVSGLVGWVWGGSWGSSSWGGLWKWDRGGVGGVPSPSNGRVVGGKTLRMGAVELRAENCSRGSFANRGAESAAILRLDLLEQRIAAAMERTAVPERRVAIEPARRPDRSHITARRATPRDSNTRPLGRSELVKSIVGILGGRNGLMTSALSPPRCFSGAACLASESCSRGCPLRGAGFQHALFPHGHLGYHGITWAQSQNNLGARSPVPRGRPDLQPLY